MDPNANLIEQRTLAARLASGNAVNEDDAMRLGELVLALDEWIGRGGFLPASWEGTN